MLVLVLFLAEEASGICRSSNGSREVHSLSSTSGTFFSPDYPLPYPDDATCIWKISVPTGKIVRLTFELLNLETDAKDYVQIRDGQQPQSLSLAIIDRFHKFSSSSGVFSTGSHMWVKFHSTSGQWVKTRGFKAHFEALDPRKSFR